ncbi:hypothetical protein SAMN05421767_10841 [Granulicatella balaenopterae]|uniref:Virus attachment protein p12 family protein n=1 Tax=Granulicatella balaenopterae TaxID=137733 RepID=A0A1H9JAJ6_9LACT|nr:hypothetical protein [Granulicatella balaenopterae]SEQ84051.1 hypothetical protein SAMN05421767_10841 [Granulicatella balaenopterae]
MNIQSWILLAIVIAAMIIVVVRMFKKGSSCESCQVEDCAVKHIANSQSCCQKKEDTR